MKMQLRWMFIDPNSLNPAMFGLSKIYALKVAKWHCKSDIRGFRLHGWELSASDMEEISPITGKYEPYSWFMYAAKGI